MVAPKSNAGTRTVVVTARLRLYLLEHQLATGRRTGLVFGKTADTPPAIQALYDRAQRAWKKAGLLALGLPDDFEPAAGKDTPGMRPHDCRHTAVSYFIAAGLNPKAVSEMMGHSSVAFTMDRYGHLFPGSRDEARVLLDAYMERQAGGS